MRTLSALLLLGLLAAPAAHAQSCNPNDLDEPVAISWPEGDNPVWELSFLPPSSSTGIVGSGLEVRDVRFNGRDVLRRGHVPILNVKYDSESCDCYRDWNYSDQVFEADNPVGSCYADSTPGTVQTMCDAAPANCRDTNGDGEPDRCDDVGSFEGVAVERFDDRLVLTTQYSAGWYRYTARWTFFADGTIHPRFGFTSTGSSCTQNPRRHHAYWRLDFDIEGGDHDFVTEQRRSAESLVFQTETTRTWGDPDDGVAWTIADLETERGYTVAPSRQDYLTPVNPGTGIPAIDDFAREDAVIARYKPGELDDGIDFEGSTPNCDAEFEGGGNATRAIVDGEDTYDTDVVFWYRSGVTKPDIDPGTCYVVGPVLTPVGDWSQNPVAAEDGTTPQGYTLEDAYPNPFDQTTTIRFSVEDAQPVTLVLYDAGGRRVRTLYEGTPTAETTQSVVMQAADLPSGVYTVRLEGEKFVGSTRVVLLK